MLVASTKGKTVSKRIANIVLSCVIFALSVIVFIIAAETRGSDDFKMVGIIMSAVFFMMGFVALLGGIISTGSYIDVYTDHVEGKGLVGNKIALNSFYLKNSQIRSATVDKGDLFIHTDSGKFKVVCTKDIAEEMFILINRGIQR